MNVEPSLGAGTQVDLVSVERFRLTAGYVAEAQHYDHDASALDAGGSYSPNLLLAQTPRLTLRFEGDDWHLDAGGGPSLQYQVLHGAGGAWLPGGEARAGGTFALARHLELTSSVGFLRVGDAYSRFEIQAGLSYVF